MATYEQGRDQEYLARLDGAISTFISHYNANPSSTNRRTLFLFPGGMGSQLDRARSPHSSPPPFSYDVAWLDCGIVFGNVTNLRMNGTGYPKRLKRDQMSPVARMMAIADVFEALTAADRPYKKAKPLSEAIKIMGFMKKDNHLDPDLLDLFLTAGVWKQYAERFLDAAQIDQPDIEAVLKTQPA